MTDREKSRLHDMQKTRRSERNQRVYGSDIGRDHRYFVLHKAVPNYPDLLTRYALWIKDGPTEGLWWRKDALRHTAPVNSDHADYIAAYDLVRDMRPERIRELILQTAEWLESGYLRGYDEEEITKLLWDCLAYAMKI